MQIVTSIQLTIKAVSGWQSWEKRNSVVCISCLDRVFTTCFRHLTVVLGTCLALSMIIYDNASEEVLKNTFLMLNDP